MGVGVSRNLVKLCLICSFLWLEPDSDSHLVPESALGQCLFPSGREMGAGRTGNSGKDLWAQGERGTDPAWPGGGSAGEGE